DSRDVLTIAAVDEAHFTRLFEHVADPNGFLSDYGLRSVSKYHEAHPFRWSYDGEDYELRYEPGESTVEDAGGNSNWRGPVWAPINQLMIESLHTLGHHYGQDFRVEYPLGSARRLTLSEI